MQKLFWKRSDCTIKFDGKYFTLLASGNAKAANLDEKALNYFMKEVETALKCGTAEISGMTAYERPIYPGEYFADIDFSFVSGVLGNSDEEVRVFNLRPLAVNKAALGVHEIDGCLISLDENTDMRIVLLGMTAVPVVMDNVLGRELDLTGAVTPLVDINGEALEAGVYIGKVVVRECGDDGLDIFVSNLQPLYNRTLAAQYHEQGFYIEPGNAPGLPAKAQAAPILGVGTLALDQAILETNPTYRDAAAAIYDVRLGGGWVINGTIYYDASSQKVLDAIYLLQSKYNLSWSSLPKPPAN